MSAFKDDFYALLSGDAGVAGEVGDRIYPVIAPQGTTQACITWGRNDGDPMATLSGAGVNRQQVNVYVHCWADDYDTAARIADAVRAAIKTGSAALRGTARPPIDDFEQATRQLRCTVQASLFHRG